MASHLMPHRSLSAAPLLAWCTVALLALLSLPPSASATGQTCPGLGPWRLKCPEYCCVEEFDEPLEGQYCCSSCRYSFDSAVRSSFACASSHYLHQTWAVVLMACGVAFVVLVCCTCCCCCCCAPCRRRRYSRRYSLPKSAAHCHGNNERTPLRFSYDAHHQASSSSSAATAPSAPPPMMTSSMHQYPQQKHGLPSTLMQPPPYQQASAAVAAAPEPPPIYRP